MRGAICCFVVSQRSLGVGQRTQAGRFELLLLLCPGFLGGLQLGRQLLMIKSIFCRSSCMTGSSASVRVAIEHPQEQLVHQLPVVGLRSDKTRDGVGRIGNGVGHDGTTEHRHDRAQLNVVRAFAFAHALAHRPSQRFEETAGQRDADIRQLDSACTGVARPGYSGPLLWPRARRRTAPRPAAAGPRRARS